MRNDFCSIKFQGRYKRHWLNPLLALNKIKTRMKQPPNRLCNLKASAHKKNKKIVKGKTFQDHMNCWSTVFSPEVAQASFIWSIHLFLTHMFINSLCAMFGLVSPGSEPFELTSQFKLKHRTRFPRGGQLGATAKPLRTHSTYSTS